MLKLSDFSGSVVTIRKVEFLSEKGGSEVSFQSAQYNVANAFQYIWRFRK